MTPAFLVWMTDQMGYHLLIMEYRRKRISLCMVEAGIRNIVPPCHTYSHHSTWHIVSVQNILKLHMQVEERSKYHLVLCTLCICGDGLDVAKGAVMGVKIILTKGDYVLLSERITF